MVVLEHRLVPKSNRPSWVTHSCHTVFTSQELNPAVHSALATKQVGLALQVGLGQVCGPRQAGRHPTGTWESWHSSHWASQLPQPAACSAVDPGQWLLYPPPAQQGDAPMGRAGHRTNDGDEEQSQHHTGCKYAQLSQARMHSFKN